jgi:hypothetical protein
VVRCFDVREDVGDVGNSMAFILVRISSTNPFLLDICYKPAKNIEPSALKGRQDAMANYDNTVRPLPSSSLSQLVQEEEETNEGDGCRATTR